MKIADYERNVIGLLCNEALPNSILYNALNHPKRIECKFTGAGYYLDIYHKDLPLDRIVCDKPIVTGKYQGIEVGFIIFIEKGTLCLECYNYGSKGVPPEIRHGIVEVATK
ncbi:hypothetical protein [Desulfoluna spongiiphila]|uniref:hypothetical protein n=1 Tax=Desulfoluna spongiiphila TaxID=419481 RepID=UPI00111445E7|nr:hypothetical protein [Desulfoluna spongiiphila]